MTTLTLVILVHTSMAAAGDFSFVSYAEAHRAATKMGKPMVVMVGADWCRPCQKMEKTVFPHLSKRGLFKNVALTIVNVDREKVLAGKLIGRGPVPQLVMYRRTPKGWVRRRLVGGHSTEAVERFIKQGIAPEKAGKKSPGQAKGKDAPTKPRVAAKDGKKAEARPVSTR